MSYNVVLPVLPKTNTKENLCEVYLSQRRLTKVCAIAKECFNPCCVRSSVPQRVGALLSYLTGNRFNFYIKKCWGGLDLVKVKALVSEMVADAVKEAFFGGTGPIAGAGACLGALLNVVNAAQESADIKVVIQGMPLVVFLRHLVFFLVFLQHSPAAPVNIPDALGALLVQLCCPRFGFLVGYLLRVGEKDRGKFHCG